MPRLISGPTDAQGVAIAMRKIWYDDPLGRRGCIYRPAAGASRETVSSVLAGLWFSSVLLAKVRWYRAAVWLFREARLLSQRLEGEVQARWYRLVPLLLCVTKDRGAVHEAPRDDRVGYSVRRPANHSQWGRSAECRVLTLSSFTFQLSSLHRETNIIITSLACNALLFTPPRASCHPCHHARSWSHSFFVAVFCSVAPSSGASDWPCRPALSRAEEE